MVLITKPRSNLDFEYSHLSQNPLLSYPIIHRNLAKNLGWRRNRTHTDIPIVLYDQIGSGASSHYRDAPNTFWHPYLFMDQLDNLLEHLDIHDNFDLLGHSWGATRPHKGLQNLIVSNAYASIELLEEGLNLHLDKFPKDFAEMIRKHELNKHHGRTRVPERHGDIRHETLVYIAAAAEGFGAVV